MTPLLHDGDEVLVAPRAACREGDVVVALHPFREDFPLVKRLEAWESDDRARLVGENPDETTDSHALGAIRRDLLRGRVTSVLPLSKRRSDELERGDQPPQTDRDRDPADRGQEAR